MHRSLYENSSSDWLEEIININYSSNQSLPFLLGSSALDLNFVEPTPESFSILYTNSIVLCLIWRYGPHYSQWAWAINFRVLTIGIHSLLLFFLIITPIVYFILFRNIFFLNIAEIMVTFFFNSIYIYIYW